MSDAAVTPTGRRPLLAVLTLAGLRIGEGLALRWRDVSLADRKLRVAVSKTDAGIREVDLTPTLAEILTEYRARVRHQPRRARFSHRNRKARQRIQCSDPVPRQRGQKGKRDA